MSLQFEKPVVLLGRTVSSVGGKPPTYHSSIPLTVLGADSQCRTPVILGTRVLLALLNFTGRGWVRPPSHPSRHRCFLVAYGLDITCDHRPLISAWEAECFKVLEGVACFEGGMRPLHLKKSQWDCSRRAVRPRRPI